MIAIKKSNSNAVSLAALALFMLYAGLTGPFMTVTTLGATSSYSIIQTISHLWHQNHLFLGGVVLFFSIIFPVSKLIFLILVATCLVPLSAAAREFLFGAAEKTARFSMIDVMVVALLIVALKVEGFAKVEAAWGTGCFLIAVIFSILSGFMVDTSKFSGINRAGGEVNDGNDSGDRIGDSVPSRPASKTRLVTFCTLGVGLLAIAGSLVLQQAAPSSEITGVLVKYKTSMLPNFEIGEYDFYLRLSFDQDGELITYQTKTVPVIRLGNGITWDVSAEKIPLTSLRKITLYEEDLFYDDQYDAVDVTLGEPLVGTSYEFVIHSSSPWFAAISPLLYSGIALLVIGGMLLLRQYAT